MKLYKYIVLSSVLMMACACVEEEVFPVEPQVGSEVQFGLSLDKGIETRTVYGPETSTGFPIYWVNGDKVLVASPQCSDGNNSAEYVVSTSTATQNYANDLTKTGTSGVQWGTSEKADFYSIYPSSGSKLVVTGNTVSATLQVAATQHATTTETNGIYYAQPKEMGNVMMYAYTPQATNGTTVDLKYKPFSTVIEFTLNAPKDAASATEVGNIIVQALTLTAPTGTNIAGSFNFNFPTSEEGSVPTIESTTGSNEIVLHFLENNEYKTVLTQNKTLKAKVCLMPIADVASMAGWKVTITTSAGTFTKTIADGTRINTALKPGMVHKIVLPTLEYGSKEWEYSLNNWITSLPDYKNIYLTEISLPGAWYAGGKTSDGYQITATMSDFWNAGVRAFAIETKTTTGGRYNSTPSGISISGTGSNSASYLTYDGGTNSLHTETGDKGRVYYDGTKLGSVITNIANCVSEEEFAVMVISYADGGASGRRYVDYGAWLSLLYNEFNNLDSKVKEKIYQEEITENTIVKDVLGHLILKINVDENIAMSGSVGSNAFNYANNIPALLSYNPFVQQLSDFTTPHYSSLHWKDWSDSYRQFSGITGFTWCFSSSNRTSSSESDIPTYTDRQTALKAMMTQSKTIYDASTHNIWFFFNCGGTYAENSTTTSTDAEAFAGIMNKWLLETIQAKTDPSPLGIVMFNQCTSDTYNGPAIIKEIIEMNSKFYLKHAGDATGGTSATSEIQSVAANYSAAVTDTGADAINWE